MKKTLKVLFIASLVIMSACGTAQNETAEKVETEKKEETVNILDKVQEFDVEQLNDRLEVKDDTVETATLFKVTEGETVRNFFVHPFTLDLNEAREVKLTVCVWNNDSTIQTFDKKVKVGTDEQIARAKSEKEKKVADAEKKDNKTSRKTEDKKTDNKKTETTVSVNNNQTQTQNTQQQTTHTQSSSTTSTPVVNTPQPTQAPVVINTPVPSTPQPAQKKCWQEQRLVKAAWTENVLIKNAWTENVLVSEAWDEEVVVGSSYVCSHNDFRSQDINEVIDHVLDVHGGAATHGVLYDYETVHHPAEYKQVNHPAEYKQVNHPAEYTTVNVCEGD